MNISNSTSMKSKKSLALTPELIEDLKRMSSKMTGSDRRIFQAQTTLKYCNGNPRRAESIFGWGRSTVKLGLHEVRTGIVCVGAQSAFSGVKRWEEVHPDAAAMLWKLAQAQIKQTSTAENVATHTGLSVRQLLKQLQAMGLEDAILPCESSMRNILQRNGYKLSSYKK